jgi:hypothetical protein
VTTPRNDVHSTPRSADPPARPEPLHGFYDATWWALATRYPLVARKLEELRCDTISPDEFQELQTHVDATRRVVQTLAEQLAALCKTVQDALASHPAKGS